jgi:hypothetical protein
MSFGDIFKHLSPLYDAATGFTGTAAPMAMMALGGKMGMSGGGMPQMPMGGVQQPNPMETEQERRKRMMIEALMRGGL